MCLYPRLIKNRKYTVTKKNGGNVPPVPDERVKYVPIGCGECMECRKQKARSWQVRLLEDIKHNDNAIFVTLTFDDKSILKIYDHLKKEGTALEGYELDNQIATQAVRWFLERWRKKYKKSLRHWFVTELGHKGTENIHLHGIIWLDKTTHGNLKGRVSKLLHKELHEKWEYGFVWTGQGEHRNNYVNEQTINYIIKYVSKQDEKHPLYKSRVLTSPGIGRNYTQKGTNYKNNLFKGTETDECYRTNSGHKISLPIYYRNKIYTEQQREQLWLQRLDKLERWVCGERVDISHSEEAYYKLLEYHRKRNKRLGYGGQQKTWEQIQYERECRMIKIRTRLQRAKENKNASGGRYARGGFL